MGATLKLRDRAWSYVESTIASSGPGWIKPTAAIGRVIDKTGFYIENILSQLDAPGEYFYDRKKSQLYVWPLKGGSPGGYSVQVVSNYPAIGIQFNGAASNNVIIRGLQMQSYSYAAIQCDAPTASLTILDNLITHIEGFGVQCYGAANIMMSGNKLTKYQSSKSRLTLD